MAELESLHTPLRSCSCSVDTVILKNAFTLRTGSEGQNVPVQTFALCANENNLSK